MFELEKRPSYVLLGNTVGNSTVAGQPLYLQGGANITLSGTGQTIIISGGAGGGGGGIALSAGTTDVTGGTVVFSNSNGVSFGLNGSTVTASHNGITLQSVQPVAASAGNGSVAFSTLSFSNANGISFSTTAGVAIIASHNGLTTQSGQAASAANGSFAFETLSFSNANGFSFGTSAGGAITGSYTVPTQSVQTLGIYMVGNTTGQSSSSTYDARTLSFDGAGIVSVGWSAGSVRLSATQSNQAFSAAGGSSAFQTLSFSDNAYASWTNNAGQVALTEIRASLFAVSNTTQSSSGTQNLDALSFAGAGVASVGITGGTIVISVPAGGGGGFSGGLSNIGNTLGDTGVVSNRLVLAGGNGITLSGSTNAESITITVSAANQTNQTLGIYAVGNTTGQSSSSTYDARTLSIDGGGIVSVGWSNSTLRVSATQSNQAFSAGGGSSAFQTLSFSDNAYASWTNNAGQVALTELRASLFAVSNTTQSSSGTQNLDALSFAGAGIASVGITGGTVVISVPAGGGGGDGGVFAGVSNLGNTSGSTGTVSTGNFVLVGSNGLTLSQSTAGAGSAATVTIYDAPPLREWDPYGDRPLVIGQVGQGSLYLNPVELPHMLQHDRVGLRVHFTNNAVSSGSATFSFWVGIYTRNVSTLSLLSSTSTTMAVTMSGTAGSYSQFGGNRLLTIPWTNTLTVGNYWLGVLSRTTTAAVNMTLSQLLVSEINSTYSGIFGAASNATAQPRLGKGHYSATTSSLPASVGFSQINGNSSLFQRAPAVYFLSESA